MKKYPFWLKSILTLSFIFSIGIVLFDIGVIPPIFGEAKKADAINRAMLNISYSYLASIVFALITVYLPSLVLSRSALMKLQSQIEAIHYNLAWCYGALSFIESNYSAQNTTDPGYLKYVKISLNDPQADPKLENINVTENRYYAKTEYKYPTYSKEKTEYIDAVTDIYDALNMINKNIASLKSNSYFYHLSYKAIDLINRIAEGKIILEASLFKKSVTNNLIIAENFNYDFSNFPELINQLEELVLKKNNICHVVFTKLPDTETALYMKYLSSNQAHGDMYRQLNLGGRIYEEDKRM